MRGLGGFVLLAGIGVGLFVYFPAPVDRDTTLEQAKRATSERVAARSETVIAPATATAIRMASSTGSCFSRSMRRRSGSPSTYDIT